MANLKVAMSAGHTLRGVGTGATGYIDEGNENRIMVNLINKWLEKAEASYVTCNVDEASNYLQLQVSKANEANADISVQIHFNAFKTVSEEMGTETYYISNSGKEYASRINNKLSTKFKNRGIKQNSNFYWLRNTSSPAVLIEICFVDSKADTDIYNANKDEIAKLIAEGIVGFDIPDEVYGTGNSKLFPQGSYQKKVEVCIDGLNVRSQRAASAPLLNDNPKSQFKRGDVTTIWYIGSAPDGAHWGSCSYDGETGFIHMGYVKPV